MPRVRKIGIYAEEYMGSCATQKAIAIINKSTSFLHLAQVTGDAATGNRMITFHMEGETKARSLNVLINVGAIHLLNAVAEMILGRVLASLTT